MLRRNLIVFAIGLSLGVGSAIAQQPAPRRSPASARPAAAISVDEAAVLTNGWALLAEGQYAQAATKAAQFLAIHPRSGAALVLAVEAELARGGAAAGLRGYEGWLRQRKLEEPLVLRRVALALLREEAAQTQDSEARLEALLALADEGDKSASAELGSFATAGGSVTTRVLAAHGDPRAVRALLSELDTTAGSKVATIEALGDSGSATAIPALVRLLGDSRQEVRGAALEALGKTGRPELASQIAPLLSDRIAYVRMKAAGALLRLGDDSGVPLLREMMADQSPATRLAAAAEMASRPDASWAGVVRDLTGAAEPEVRAEAAQLILSQDPALARTVLESLAQDPNPVIRELASKAMSELATSDLTTLRGLMKNAYRLTRVRGAARVLVATR
jgi:HEAT repeat protein